MLKQLSANQQVTLFAIALAREADPGDVHSLYNTQTRGASLMPVMTLARVRETFAELDADGWILAHGRDYILNHALDVDVATQLYLLQPGSCRGVCNAYLALHRLKPPTVSGKHVTLGQRRAANQVLGWLHALTFTNQPDVWERVYALRAEIIADRDAVYQEDFEFDAHMPLLGLEPRFLSGVDPFFTVVALEYLAHTDMVDATALDEAYVRLLTSSSANFCNANARAYLVKAAVERLHLLPENLQRMAAFPGVQGAAAMLRGQRAEAAKYFTRHRFDADCIDFAHLLSLLLEYGEGRATIKDFAKLISKPGASATPALVNAFAVAVLLLSGRDEDALGLVASLLMEYHGSRLLQAFLPVMLLWGRAPVNGEIVDLLASDYDDLEEYPYLDGEYCTAMLRLSPKHAAATDWGLGRSAVTEAHGFHFLTDLLVGPEAAAADDTLLLRFIEGLAAAEPAAPPDVVRKDRLLWIADFRAQYISAKRQKRSKKGGFTPGAQVTLLQVATEAKAGELPRPDAAVAAEIVNGYGRPLQFMEYYYGGWYCQDYEAYLPLARGLYALAGHDNVVYEERNVRRELFVTRGKTQFSVVETSEGIQLAFLPKGATAEYHYELTAPGKVTAYKLTPEEVQLSQKLTAPATLPAAQREALERVLPQLRKSINVSSTLDIDTSLLERRTSANVVRANLFPFEAGYQLELLIEPLPGSAYYVRPGEGLAEDIVTLNPEADAPERVMLSRDLPAETTAVEALVAAAPSLREGFLGEDPPQYHWTFATPGAALHLLQDLQRLQAEHPDTLRVEYPRGQKLKLVGGLRDTADLGLGVTRQRDWFAVSGNLKIDENRVLDFAQLLAHSRANEGAFVQLDDGEYVALSEDLQKRMAEMEALLYQRSGTASLAPLAVGAFADLIDDFADVELDERWHEQVARAEEAKAFVPTLPTNFDATLRDYQEDGFRWAMRLAAWGVGACLADDMGLGKTIQALAVFTARAREGAAMVIAPASVTRNWVRETERFAPGLIPILVAGSAEAHVIEQAGPGDVLIVSYGLLAYVEEELKARSYATLLLDEAQAIKNPAAKRSRLLFELEADFRMATTGTPVENNLVELWSLFRFLNPGLLGSQQAFTAKFARPLAMEGASDVLRDQLRRLVQPFILRRRKDQVLKELPAKTEIVLEVEPSEKERALYEAIRREAVEALSGANAEQQRFMVLQQLTRLRQAACHPRLVRPTSKLPSAKLELVAETIEELREGGHRALVFSQFVKHLKLVEAHVAAAGIPYFYLDGSTPGKKRAELVERFQAGEAELFLISLKAGGTGLNLTGANYVLHLDPWWNPAVEDQASDRAHRMGQQQPVTVYRFVSTGTIEEQIIALHAEKRDLADQLLAGTEGSAKLSVEDMVRMVTGGKD